MERISPDNVSSFPSVANIYAKSTNLTAYEMNIPESSAQRHQRKKGTPEVMLDFEHQVIPLKSDNN